jgi:hypothetical protein
MKIYPLEESLRIEVRIRRNQDLIDRMRREETSMNAKNNAVKLRSLSLQRVWLGEHMI